MRFTTLDDWLQWQMQLHPRLIDPGVERIGAVADALGLRPPEVPVITVGGTNGKGSSVALLAAILEAAGYRTGAYTSPHLLRYNERIRIGGAEAGDPAIMAAFDAIDRARGEISLSYFEFNALAALWLFRAAAVDVMILEVGLGGRLDAVNMIDPDAALITSIGLDHAEWLGPDRESIGREKAGILRPGRPAVFAGEAMPDSIAAHAEQLGTPLRRAGADYHWQATGAGRWSWQGVDGGWPDLPEPWLPGPMQLRNAAGCLAVLDALSTRLPVTAEAVATGLGQARVPGRLEVIPGEVEWLLDVAHNADAAEVLAAELRRRPVSGRCHAVLALMARKELEPVLAALSGLVDVWWPLALPDPDAHPAEVIATAAAGHGGEVAAAGDAADRVARLDGATAPGDRVVVFGSFRTVEEMVRATRDTYL